MTWTLTAGIVGTVVGFFALIGIVVVVGGCLLVRQYPKETK